MNTEERALRAAFNHVGASAESCGHLKKPLIHTHIR